MKDRVGHEHGEPGVAATLPIRVQELNAGEVAQRIDVSAMDRPCAFYEQI